MTATALGKQICDGFNGSLGLRVAEHRYCENNKESTIKSTGTKDISGNTPPEMPNQRGLFVAPQPLFCRANARLPGFA